MTHELSEESRSWLLCGLLEGKCDCLVIDSKFVSLLFIITLYSGAESPPVATTSSIETAELATPAIPRGRPEVLRMLGLIPVKYKQI